MTDTTIVVVPRERFSLTKLVLETLFRNTVYPFHLVWVDGYSPPKTANYLQQEAAARGFTLIRTEHSLSPNQARNLGLTQVRTPYVVFMDNDLLVKPGWLKALVLCAKETQAAVVSPLQLEKRHQGELVHIAGGQACVMVKDGQRRFVEKHRFRGQPVEKVAPYLKREPVHLAEFHSILVRSNIFKTYGMFDENLLSAAEHTDLCMQLNLAGEAIWFEPKAQTVYIPPAIYKRSSELDDLLELAYFLLRWSDKWNEQTLNYFCTKWSIPRQDPVIKSMERWLQNHRLQVAGAYLST